MATPRNGTSIIPKRDTHRNSGAKQARNGTSMTRIKIPKRRNGTSITRISRNGAETGHPLSFRRIQISMDVLIRLFALIRYRPQAQEERDIRKGENRILINYLAQGQNQPLKTSGTWMVHPTARRTDKPVDT